MHGAGGAVPRQQRVWRGMQELFTRYRKHCRGTVGGGGAVGAETEGGEVASVEMYIVVIYYSMVSLIYSIHIYMCVYIFLCKVQTTYLEYAIPIVIVPPVYPARTSSSSALGERPDT